MTRQLWVLAGGNGAGKSTFYNNFLAPRGLRFVNADSIARHIAPDAPEKFSYEAAARAEVIRRDLLNKGLSFCFETVFSHPSKIDFLADARTHGYQIVLVYFHLEEPQLNAARVSQRVQSGGHDVPEKKIYARIPRTMKNITTALPLCDEVFLIDNSSAENPFMVVARIIDTKIEQIADTLPDWALEILGR